MEFDPCVYCGMPSDDVDHVPPLSRAETLLDLDPDIPLWTVPACSTCNRWLGSAPTHTVGGRRSIIISKLAKLASGRGFACWTEEELSEIGPNMQREIRSKMRQDDLLLSRLQWARDMPVLLDINGEAVPEHMLRTPARIVDAMSCRHCGEEFVRGYKNQAYCSAVCRKTHNKRPAER
jgi:ferredoxin